MAKLDLRLVQAQDPDEIFEKLKAHLVKGGFDDIEARMVGKFYPYKTPVTDPFVGALTRSAAQAYQCEPVIQVNSPASGGRASVGITLGIPVAGIGVANKGSNIHAPNENIRLADYIIGIKHVVLLLDELGSS